MTITPVTTPPNAGADKLIADAQTKIRACYNKALALDPQAKGQLVLHLNVNMTGLVVGAIQEQRTVPLPLADCAAGSLSRISFEKLNRPWRTVVTVDFALAK